MITIIEDETPAITITLEELEITDTFECAGSYYLVSHYEDGDEDEIKIAVNLETGEARHGFNKNAILRIVNLEMKKKINE